jgi:hypothetical protein
MNHLITTTINIKLKQHNALYHGENPYFMIDTRVCLP